MLFRYEDCYYATRIEFPGNNRKQWKLDTGSPITTVSLHFISQMFSCDIDLVKTSLSQFETVDFLSFSGSVVKMCPVCLRSAIIGDLFIDTFYAFVNMSVDKSTHLIGADFISACSFKHNKLFRCINVDVCDVGAYYSNFLGQCRGVAINEILSIEQPRKLSVAEMLGRI